MTAAGLTEGDRERIREAAESDDANMAQILADDGHLSARTTMSTVDVRECALIRCMRGLGLPTSEIRDETGRTRQTTRRHATGRCSHDCRVPPTVYKTGAGTLADGTPIDERETRKRRREWRVKRALNDGGDEE